MDDNDVRSFLPFFFFFSCLSLLLFILDHVFVNDSEWRSMFSVWRAFLKFTDARSLLYKVHILLLLLNYLMLFILDLCQCYSYLVFL